MLVGGGRTTARISQNLSRAEGRDGFGQRELLGNGDSSMDMGVWAEVYGTRCSWGRGIVSGTVSRWYSRQNEGVQGTPSRGMK